ncbi:hypothetical protein EDB85DRAFT_1468652 [Lactarius pseudohatsudake]|nr:hypothetical protein EDB85DRAFT_1468652 [Lactarius pseudohatsudake]
MLFLTDVVIVSLPVVFGDYAGYFKFKMLCSIPYRNTLGRTRGFACIKKADSCIKEVLVGRRLSQPWKSAFPRGCLAPHSLAICTDVIRGCPFVQRPAPDTFILHNERRSCDDQVLVQFSRAGVH